MNDMTLVTVCDFCLTEACFKGEFYCENYKAAGTCEIPKFRAEKYRDREVE